MAELQANLSRTKSKADDTRQTTKERMQELAALKESIAAKQAAAAKQRQEADRLREQAAEIMKKVNAAKDELLLVKQEVSGRPLPCTVATL